MFDKNVTVDDETHYFESLRGKNHVAASICAQVVLISDSLQVQHNNTINRTGQKFPPSGNSTFFKVNREHSRTPQCAKSRALAKLID